MSSLLESGYALTATAAAWLEAHPEHAKLDSSLREASLAVSLMHGVITTQMSDWMTGDGDVTANDEDFHRAMAEYRIVLRPACAGVPAAASITAATAATLALIIRPW